MGSDFEAMAARMRLPRETGGKPMWYMVMMNAVLDLFEERDVISYEDLRRRLDELRQEAGESKLMLEACDTAIAELDRRWTARKN